MPRFSAALAPLVAALVACLPLQAQIQPQAPLEGEMLPVNSCSRDYLEVIKDGRGRLVPRYNYQIKPAKTFAEGFVRIEHEQPELDPLRSAGDRAKPAATRFRYNAEVTADRSLPDCYALLTFVSGGSIGNRLIPIGHLGGGSSHHVFLELPVQVDRIGSLHLFSRGIELRTNQHPEAYEMKAYYATVLAGVRGLSAAALLDAARYYPHVLSDDGHYVATFRNRDANRLLLVVDLETMKMVREIAMTGVEAYVDGPIWVSDHEVAYIAQDVMERRVATTHLFILDIRTGEKRQMLEDVVNIIERVQDHPEILVLKSYHNGDSFFKCDTRTGRAFAFEDPDGGEYWFDVNGVSRIELRQRDNSQTYYCRRTPGGTWQRLDGVVKQPGLHFDSHGQEYLERVADIIGLGPDGDTLYIADRAAGDRFELAALSLSEGVIKHTLARLPHCDLTSGDDLLLWLGHARHGRRLMTILYEDQKPHVIWTDPKFRAIQKAMDSAFPDHFNHPIDFTDDGQTLIYLSESDRDPGTYYAFHPAKSELVPLMQRNEHLKGQALSPSSPYAFTARDGQTIPGYLTLPADAKAAVPLIVNIHGGPATRDHWGFDAWNQFFASRGYAVLQVNYRGSSGYGAAFQRSGLYARLDTIVIDDIADGVKSLIAKGIANPKKIAVTGGSFGGWATYISLARYPDLYRAGVAIAAVSSWKTTMSDDRWALDNKFGYRYMKAIMDRENFSENARFIEPILRADEIHQPVLIMHGEKDDVVRSTEAGLMLKALKRGNPQVEARLFENASHRDWPFADEVELLNATAEFLQRYGVAPGPAPAATTGTVAAD